MIGMVSLPLRADEATCKSVLHDCDSALQAEIKENALQKQIITDQSTVIQTQHSELDIDKIWKPLCIGGFVVISVETLVILFKK